MRIATNMIYNQTISDINDNMRRLMEHKEKEASQKRLNKPSDDPGGYSLTLDLNSYLTQLGQYDENIGTAKAWLNLGDSTLTQVSTVLTKSKELAEQASTGTLTNDQRQTIAKQARALFNQMITLGNTKYNGKSIFGGHKTDGNAYTVGVAGTLSDSRLPADTISHVTGGVSGAVGVRFPTGGTVGGAANIAAEYTLDGGKTWKTATLAAGSTALTVEGATINLKNGVVIPATEKDRLSMIVRPSGVYQGDDADDIDVRHTGSSNVTTIAAGPLQGPTTVRIDTAGPLNGNISYSYSTDGGETWVTGNTAQNGVFTLPGGKLTVTPNPSTGLTAGEQFQITPHAARISMDIGPNASVDINSVGKDIFGGLYQRPGTTYPTGALPDTPDANILEAMGELVGYLETNDQSGVSKALDKLKKSHEHLTTMNGEVGARETRVEVMAKTVGLHKDNTNKHKSQLEDQDVIQLTQDIKREMFIYEAIASTSGKLMNLSILKYM